MATRTSTPATTPGMQRGPRRPATATAALHAWLLWTAGFVAFPLSGIAGMLVAGRVDRPAAAALAGLATGAVLGAGQALASSHRLPPVRWVAATAVGMSAGLVLGATAVDFGTSLGSLAVMGAVTGSVLGLAQAAALPPPSRHRWVWGTAMPVLWALGWAVTTSVGVAVGDQFPVFGASGAVTVTALLGILLHRVLPPAQAEPRATLPPTTSTTPSALATPAAPQDPTTTTATIGDQS